MSYYYKRQQGGETDPKNRFSQSALIPNDELTAYTRAAGCGGSGTPCTSQWGNPSRYLVLEKHIQAPSLSCSEWEVGISAIKDIANETEKSFSFVLLHSVLVLALGEYGVCDLHV